MQILVALKLHFVYTIITSKLLSFTCSAPPLVWMSYPFTPWISVYVQKGHFSCLVIFYFINFVFFSPTHTRWIRAMMKIQYIIWFPYRQVQWCRGSLTCFIGLFLVQFLLVCVIVLGAVPRVPCYCLAGRGWNETFGYGALNTLVTWLVFRKHSSLQLNSHSSLQVPMFSV